MMITNKDIRMAINRQLNKTGIKIMSRDVQEGFNRPSFFVELDNVLREGNADQVYKSMTIRIYYFPSNEYEYAIEVLDMQETIEGLFDLKLLVRDRLINVEEFTSFLNDGVLTCQFDIEFYEGRTYDGYGNTIIEQLIIDKENENRESGKDFYEKHPIEKMEKLDIKE